MRTPPPFNRRFVKMIPLLCAAIRGCLREHPDRLLAMAWTHEGVAVRIASVLLRIPYAVVTHGSELIQGQRSWLRRAVMSHVLRKSRVIIANSEFTRRLVIGLGIASNQVEVVNPSLSIPAIVLDSATIDHRFGLANKRVILTAGKLVQRRGHDHIVRALAELRRTRPDVVYVIVGDGPRRPDIKALIARCGLAEAVLMIGRVSVEELWGLYGRADVYASLVSDDDGEVEGFGVALIEAGASGTPVVTGTGGGVEDAVRHGVTGLIVDGKDVNALTLGLRTLLDDAGLRRRLGRAAAAWTRKAYDPTAQGLRLIRLLESEER